jgi:hypothetical protein
VPYGLMRMRFDRQDRRKHAGRVRRLREAEAAAAARTFESFSYARAIEFLVERGLDETEVREGSVPLESLEFARGVIAAHADGAHPLVAVHVGNFVGVSLAYMTAALRSLHPRSLVVSVDPGMPHRGIPRPDEHALALLELFGLQDASLTVTGYSLGKNLGDDPSVAGEDQLRANLDATSACENVLANLLTLVPGKVDVAFLDGNHDPPYLRAELDTVTSLVRGGGLVIVDDLDWSELAEVIAGATKAGASLQHLADDGRMAILRRDDHSSGASTGTAPAAG